MGDPSDRLIDLFHEALSRAPGSEREHFLRDVGQDDPELEAQLVSLLQSHARIGDFLEPRRDLGSPTPMAEQPGDYLGPYRLIEQIGEGGCGVVYLAEQEKPILRRVALKIIKLGMDTRSVVARFEAERQVLARMDHPNIARVLDAGATANGRPFFVMEVVRGRKITDYCEEAALSVAQRLRLFICVCQAVQHAHQKGIIHRDLKPSNVLVAPGEGPSDPGVPKVIDFGIAKATSGQRLTDQTVFTALEQFLGTPAYMSPEQAEMSGLDVDTRSDIYSLGVLLYELLTGTTPFDTRDLMRAGLDGVRKIIREREPLRPSTRVRHAPGECAPLFAMNPSRFRSDLDWIVMKCLEKDRSRRYETANALAADVTRYLTDEPVIARPPSTAYRFRKAFQRHRLAFAATGAVAISLLIGLATSLRKTAEAEAANRVAEARLYASKMNQVQNEWQRNNLARVRQLLEETANNPDRGFEWYYWQRQAHLPVRVLRGHKAAVTSVAVSHDGAWIVTGSFDGTARLWNAETGDEIQSFVGHKGEIQSVAFSPDGRRVLTAGRDRMAVLWDAATGEQLQRFTGHAEWLSAAAFSVDGLQVVTASADGTARIWNTTDGSPVSAPLQHGAAVWTVAFSRDGKRLLTGSAHEWVTLWNVADGSRVAATNGSAARIDPWESGMASLSTMPFAAAFSPDDQWIVTGSADQIAVVWNAATLQIRCVLQGNTQWRSPLQQHIPFAVMFSPDGQRLATGGLDHTVTLWNLTNRSEQVVLRGHEAEITSIAFHPKGRWLVTGSIDRTARIWSASGTNQVLLLTGHSNTVPVAAFSKDGARIITGGVDGTARVWETTSGRQSLKTSHGSTQVWAAAFSPDGSRFAVGLRNGTLKVSESATGRELLVLPGDGRSVVSITFSADGERLLAGASDGSASGWNVISGKRLFHLERNSQLASVFAFSPDGRRVLSATAPMLPPILDEQPAAWVWDTVTEERLFTLPPLGGGITAAAFAPAGDRFATASWDEVVRVWDARNGDLLDEFRGHNAHTVWVVWSPDGRRILTGSFDDRRPSLSIAAPGLQEGRFFQWTKVWDAIHGLELLTLNGAIGMGFSPDGRRIVAGGVPPVHVWEAASDSQVAQWREEEGILVRPPAAR